MYLPSSHQIKFGPHFKNKLLNTSVTHTLSFICIILSHLRQNWKLLCPKVVALHIRLKASITFWIYYLIIHQCNKIISKFTPICLTGSFWPERCLHLWTLGGVVASWNYIAAIPCISHFTATRNLWVIGILQHIEVKVCFYLCSRFIM